jgi:hypothetical protein
VLIRVVLLLLCALSPGAQPVSAQPWVRRAEWGSAPQPIPDSARHTPRRIVLHHAGVVWKSGDDPLKKIKGLQSWGQREKNWPDVPYHFLIAPDGRIFEGREMHYRPESNTNYDLTGVLNVHLWGNFDEQRVNETQLRATRHLLLWLETEHGLRELRTHQEEAAGQTSCPGSDLQRYVPLLRQHQAELLPPLPSGPEIFIQP